MSIMGKQEWIEGIDSKLREFADGIISVGDSDYRMLRTMSVKQLALVEDLIARCLAVSCATGCGDCESCREQNKRADERAKAREVKP